MTISRFIGDYRFLSNFWRSRVYLINLYYPTVEHAFQAAKTLDHNERVRFTKIMTPTEAKRAGKKLVLRPDWEEVKIPLMLALLRMKFYPDGPLAIMLRDTAPHDLIEGNHWHDTFWGQCYCSTHNWTGDNNLGKLLMQVREEISHDAPRLQTPTSRSLDDPR